MCRSGEAVALVTATGARTKFGRTAELVRTAHVVSSQQKAVLRVVRNLAAFNGTLAARTTFGVGRNDQHASILGYYNSPTPAWIECADWCAANAIRIKVNPAQGLSTQPLNLLPPPVYRRFTTQPVSFPRRRMNR